MGVFINFLKFYYKKTDVKFQKLIPIQGREFEVIEMFSQVFLGAFFAGICTALTGHFNRVKDAKSEDWI